jgi:hypothetical protein
MAKSFYKYVEREADSFVNWADIGKNMSDMLIETNRVREEKKDAIDQASRDFQNKLNNVPTGQDASARREALAYADNASKFMLMQDRLLKSGRMKLKDYTIGRQNILDDTDRIFDTMSKYQTQYGERMQRYKDGKSSLGELKNMEKIEGFGNWEKSGTYINPETGRVVMAMKEERIVDGKKVYAMSTNPNNFASIATLDGLMGEFWDKFDVAKVTDEWSSKLGTNLQEMSVKNAGLMSTGLIRSREDITKRTDLAEDEKTVLYKFIDAENDYINASLTNPFNRASTLLDYVGQASNKQAYFFTTDKSEANRNPAAILEVTDPVTQAITYQFNAEQIKESQDYVRNIARSKYKIENKLETTPQIQLQERRAKTQAEYDADAQRKTAQNFGENLAFALTGPGNQADAGTKYLSDVSGLDITRTKAGFVVVDKDGRSQTYNFRADGSLANPLAFAKSFVGAVNTIGVNEDDVLKAFSARLKRGAVINEATEVAPATRPKAAATAAAAPTVIIPKDVFTKESGTAAKNLQKFLPKGFTAVDVGGWAKNIIHVYAPGESAANGNTPYEFNTKIPSSTISKAKEGLELFIKGAQDGELN